MGEFFVRYFASKGFAVSGSDPVPPRSEIESFTYHKSNRGAVKSAEVVLVAVPMKRTIGVISGILTSLEPGALLVEISSIKGKIHPALRRLARKNPRKVTCLSLHPLFGPSLVSMKDAKIALVPILDKHKELAEARRLFRESSVFAMNVDEHDRKMAFVLSLTYVLNMAYAKTLSTFISPEDFRRIASPTAELQLSVAEGVLSHDPLLYSEIAVENRHTKEVVESLAKNLEEISSLIGNVYRRRFEKVFSKLQKSYSRDATEHDAIGRIYSKSTSQSERR